MVEVEGITRKWGRSSLAFVIPREVVERERLRANQKLKAIILKQENVLAKTFGMLKKWKKPTKKIMREIDRELWHEA
jgi:predicted DNA-binding antitoxin AbrB/MazE fold protein